MSVGGVGVFVSEYATRVYLVCLRMCCVLTQRVTVIPLLFMAVSTSIDGEPFKNYSSVENKL